jgi:hypothetical protein
MTAFAAEWLTKLFGSEIVAAIKKTSATRWNSMPFVLGAMSSAVPGGQPARSILKGPIGCLFFAGEATHETLWGTVDGAWESGERAAEAALQKIGPPRAAPAARAPTPQRTTRAPRPRHQAEPHYQTGPRSRTPFSPID